MFFRLPLRTSEGVLPLIQNPGWIRTWKILSLPRTQSECLQEGVLLDEVVGVIPFLPKGSRGGEFGGDICTSRSCITSSRSSVFKRQKKSLWEFLGKYGHLLVTWEGNKVKGLGDLKTAGPGEGRWQRSSGPLGRVMKT